MDLTSFLRACTHFRVKNTSQRASGQPEKTWPEGSGDETQYALLTTASLRHSVTTYYRFRVALAIGTRSLRRVMIFVDGVA